MAQPQPRKLDSGDAFPALEFRLLDGSALNLPEAWAGRWGVVLLYRGHW